MNRFLTALLAFVLVLGAMPLASTATAVRTVSINNSETSAIVVELQPGPQSQAPAQNKKIWKITLNARVVSNRGDSLIVYLRAPERMAVNESDSAQALQSIPIKETSAALDGNGNAISMDAVLPGQEVRVEFEYYWNDNASPRTSTNAGLISVQLQGTVIRRKSTARVDDFAQNVLVGTVLAKTGNTLAVYVEAGRVVEGNTEYIERGLHQVRVPGSAVIADENGKLTTFNSIEPYQRISLQVGEALWASSYPPKISVQSTNRIHLIGQGEKIFPPSELQHAQSMTATVQGLATDSSGNNVLVVSADEGSRARRHGSTYQIVASAPGNVYTSAGAVTTISSLQPGMRIHVKYTGIVLAGDGSAGQIPWFNSIQIL